MIKKKLMKNADKSKEKNANKVDNILKFCTFLSVFALIFTICVELFTASAVNYSTYSDTLQNNSTVQSLLSLRTLSDEGKHYCCFRASQYKYILLVGSDITGSDNHIDFNDCLLYEYDSSITGNSTKYHLYSNQSGKVSISHVVTSDVINYSSKDSSTHYFSSVIYTLLFIVILLLLFNIIRRFK